MTQQEMISISKDYHAGTLSKEMIEILEEANNRSIDEIVAFIDKAFLHKRHNLKTMTITDIRKWLRKKNVSDEEKKLYSEINKCSYDEAVRKAQERLENHDAVREFKQLDMIFGLTQETRESRRKASQELIDRGYGELLPDGKSVIMRGDNFIKYFKEK